MNLKQLISLFAASGVIKLLAKPLAENDNSKNQVYFAGAVEALNVFPIKKVFAKDTSQGPSFKATMDFFWLLENGSLVSAPNAQLILYSQYPEVRFSGFLKGCEIPPSRLMMDRQRAEKSGKCIVNELKGRVLFLGITSNQKVIGYVAPGNSEIVKQFNLSGFNQTLLVFHDIPLPGTLTDKKSKELLVKELRRINLKGWINSKQLNKNGIFEPCNASQCGGYTLEAELGIPKNSKAEPDFYGWEVKQHSVGNFENVNSGSAITLMTPEPNGGFYKEKGIEKFIRTFGYKDKNGVPDRINFGGIHRVGEKQTTTGLKLVVEGYDLEKHEITKADGKLALVTAKGVVAASWSFSGLFSHWSRKHEKAVYVPSQMRMDPVRQYCYGNIVRLAQSTNSLKFLDCLISNAIFYDPGIKMEFASTKPNIKRRSQFRIASKNIPKLYESLEIVHL